MSDPFAFSRDSFLAETRLSFAAAASSSMALLTGITDWPAIPLPEPDFYWCGVGVKLTRWAPPGTLTIVGPKTAPRMLIADRTTAWRAGIAIPGWTPLWTRHMVGVREAERDRRRRRV